MPKDLYPDLIRLLLDAGCERMPGGKGSHEKWKRADGLVLIVPRSKSRHTANAVLKQAGLPKAF
jgi:predicted RNA binding protein YcfA (HicA-like mRNA interferase family)